MVNKSSAFYLIVTLLQLVDVQSKTTATKKNQKLLIILADGFRFDYVQKIPQNGGIAALLKSGVTAEYVRPVFPTKSYPNWYTIATG